LIYAGVRERSAVDGALNCGISTKMISTQPKPKGWRFKSVRGDCTFGWNFIIPPQVNIVKEL